MNLKDKDGFRYKYPTRQCVNCKKYPCITNMEKLYSNFAGYGCRLWEDNNMYNI